MEDWRVDDRPYRLGDGGEGEDGHGGAVLGDEARGRARLRQHHDHLGVHVEGRLDGWDTQEGQREGGSGVGKQGDGEVFL